MRIAFTTTFDAADVHNWSGTPYYMSQGFIKQGIGVDFIGNLKRKLPPFFKLQQVIKKKLAGQRETPRFNQLAAKHYSLQAGQQLAGLKTDAVVSPLINPIAYLECKQPIVLWTDAVYASLVGFYPPFCYHSASSIRQGNQIMSDCLARCELAIFSSDWAAHDALRLYGVSRDKVQVVPFGANIESYPDFDAIKSIVANRPRDVIKLLFLAKTWQRKGGDTVVAVAKALHAAGHAVELTIVGYEPTHLYPLPSYIRCLGFISKQDVSRKNQLQQLLAQHHFLFVPSRAEAYGIVFCEANAFAVPCLTTYVGGISTIIKDNLNGMTFGVDAAVSVYCDYLVNLMQQRSRYEAMAFAAYNEFITRLNWPVSVKTVQQLIQARL